MSSPNGNINNGITPEVISLIRFSTNGQVAEGKAGVDGQREVNKASAQLHGVKIRREMVVVNVSGADVLDDPDFQKLFAELRDDSLSGVLLPEQSRLVRPETFDDWAVLAHFQRNRKMIYTPTGRIDPNTPEGRMALTMGGMMSGEELHNLKSRFARGKAKDRLNRKHPGGDQMLPKTVRYVREREINANGKSVVISTRWELVPLEVERMKRAFQLLFDGDSYEVIAEKIGGGWTGKGIHYAMMNPIHIGIRRYEWEAKGEKYLPEPSAKNPTPKKRRRLAKREVPLDVPTRLELEAGAKPIVEPIISRVDFDRAQEIIAGRMSQWRKSKLKNDGRDRFLGNGVARCSCGEPLYPKYGSRSSAADCYICRSRYGNKNGGCGMKSVKRIDTDAAVIVAIQMLADADFLVAALKAALELREAAPNPARIECERALAKLEEGRKEGVAAMFAGEITREEFRQQMAILNQEVRVLEALVPAPAPALDVKQIVRAFDRTFQRFATLSFLDQRAVLRGAVKSIIVDSHARAITTVTISGGYLGFGVNSVLPSTTQYGINAIPDLTIRFPHPVAIPDTYVDGRSRNGNHPASIAARWESIQ